MRIVQHISFFYLEDRLQYLNQIILESNKYHFNTDIFIHTNVQFATNKLPPYNNGKVTIIQHDLTGINPHYLTWKCRDLLKQQRNEYDIFMYLEDDILVSKKALEYWLNHNHRLIELNYNLGFVRIEVNAQNKLEYIHDITNLHGGRLDTFIELDGKKFCVNNKNQYCAFWIYNKHEFNRFIDSKYYDINNIANYYIREASAIGLHGWETPWYKNTVIPLVDNKLHPDCRVYHLPNNYVNDSSSPFAKVLFTDCFA